MKTLQIGGIAIPAVACLDLDQSYEILGGETVQRTMAGAGIKQETWHRLRITTSGGGWLPNGLLAVDFTAQQSVACIVPRSVIADGSLHATLPAARRSDTGYTPWALALLDDGSMVPTAVSIATDTTTVTAVANAIGYQVLYFPLVTCWLFRPKESGSRGEASYRWEMVAEEV